MEFVRVVFHDLEVQADKRIIQLGCIKIFSSISFVFSIYLTVILRGRAGYELIYITNEAVGRVGYYQLISGKSESVLVNFQAILN